MIPDSVSLHQRHGIPNRVAIAPGLGGWPTLYLQSRQATASLSLYGGQVLSFRRHALGEDLLFVSERARARAGQAIRGGIPVCWPWFGPDPEGRGRPSHGLVRTGVWALIRTTSDATGDSVQVTLARGDDPTTRALWPYPFELTLTVEVSDRLTLSLTPVNRGVTPLTVSQGLHTYLRVGDAARVQVHGLNGRRYWDKLAGAPGLQSGVVTVGGPVDRVFPAMGYPLHVEDPAAGRRIRIEAQGSRSSVVWNPGRAGAAALADLAEEEAARFVCVETTNVQDDAVTLPPGGEHRLTTTYAVDRY